MNVIEIEALSRALGQTTFEFLLRSCVLFAVGALALVVLRTRSAEIRYFVCRGVLSGLLCLPLLQVAAPPQVFTNSGEFVSQFGPLPWISIAAAVYALFTFAFLLRLAIGVVRVHRVVRRSELILDRNLQELGNDIWLESLSSFKPRIRASADINAPMVAGIREFSILLPSSWRLWRHEKLRAALIHEMAHVRRGDPQTAFLAAVTTCVFWIHPLMHWLRRQLAALSEQACDEAALAHVRPEQYARILIEFASDVAITGTRFLAAPAVVANRSSIKKRLERIFLTPRHPDAHPRRTRLIVTALFLPVLYLSAAGRFVPARNDGRQNVLSIENLAQALRFESELRKDPDNLPDRDALIAFYANERNEAQVAKHTLWVVEHHPEDPIVAVTSNFLPTRESYKGLKAAWKEALESAKAEPIRRRNIRLLTRH